MLKAFALYMVIIVSLLISIFSATLITTAYLYRLGDQKAKRMDKLSRNLESGIAIVLSADFDSSEPKTIDLFGDETDSISLVKEQWGIFDLASVKAFDLKDSVSKTFLIGENTALDQAAIYMSDEDRPVSVSGNTNITGEAFLPKAGVKQAYVDGKAYQGKELVHGKINVSEKTLPALSQELIDQIELHLKDSSEKVKQIPDSLWNSFYNPEQKFRLAKRSSDIEQSLDGKISIRSDTVVRIKKTSRLRNVIVYAPAIIVEEGFNGNCQLFVTDSIIVGKNCVFTYPSCIGVLKPQQSKDQPRIQIGAKTSISGVVFSYERTKSQLQTIISLGKDSRIKGEVFACGFIKIENPVTVAGKVSCNRFIIQTPSTLYENYLIDVTIDRKARSKYYLTSALFGADKPINQVLQWLN